MPLNLTVGQKVAVSRGLGRRTERADGEVVKICRKYVTVAWGEGHYRQDQFDIETGYLKGDRWGNVSRIKTVEQAEADSRFKDAKRYLYSVGVDVSYRSALNPYDVRLSQPLVEELAAIVRNRLAEKPTDYESEIQGR